MIFCQLAHDIDFERTWRLRCERRCRWWLHLVVVGVAIGSGTLSGPPPTLLASAFTFLRVCQSSHTIFSVRGREKSLRTREAQQQGEGAHHAGSRGITRRRRGRKEGRRIVGRRSSGLASSRRMALVVPLDFHFRRRQPDETDASEAVRLPPAVPSSRSHSRAC